MAVNPMQRQARNSFLLGMALALLIGAAVAVVLFLYIRNLNTQLEEEQAQTVSVYILNQDVKSGQVITSDLFTLTTVKSAGVPADATSNITSTLSAYSLCDAEGNPIKTGYATTGDASTAFLYIEYSDGTTENIYQEDATGEYYTQDSAGNKTYITTTEQALIAKIDLKAKTVLSASFIQRSDEAITSDVREQEYNVIVLPTELMTGDYIDIRLMLPNGQDFIVVSKKQVTVPIVNGAYSDDTITINLSEDETLAMSNAIVEAWKIEGSKLYATTYTDAGIQEAATPTYVVNDSVASLIENDPNIVSEAMTELRSRYNANDGALKEQRNNYINSALEEYGNDDNVAEELESSITSTQESRQEYLQSLTSSTTTDTTSSN